jgi:hypothetical protein
MHLEALPQSLVSLVGERYARAFYRYCSGSAHELVLVERDGGALAAACLVSLEPDTLSRRLLKRTPLLLLSPFALGRLPLTQLLRGALRPSGPAQPRGPELLLIFTLAEARGQGLGARLLDAANSCSWRGACKSSWSRPATIQPTARCASTSGQGLPASPRARNMASNWHCCSRLSSWLGDTPRPKRSPRAGRRACRDDRR